MGAMNNREGDLVVSQYSIHGDLIDVQRLLCQGLQYFAVLYCYLMQLRSPALTMDSLAYFRRFISCAGRHRFHAGPGIASGTKERVPQRREWKCMLNRLELSIIDNPIFQEGPGAPEKV